MWKLFIRDDKHNEIPHYELFETIQEVEQFVFKNKITYYAVTRVKA
jgi:hypothetical protein